LETGSVCLVGRASTVGAIRDILGRISVSPFRVTLTFVKKKTPSRVSISAIAEAAGISKAAAGYALQNKPEVSRATRHRVLRIARRMGYAPDPRLASWMIRVRETKAKDLLPIAWLNVHTEEDAWHRYTFLSPYLEGARERSLQLGYHLEEFWLRQPGMTLPRISQILYQRGIEGAIVTNHLRHFRFDWDHLAGVSLEGGLLAPRLSRVMSDNLFNLQLALKMVKRAGYRRIGICLNDALDGASMHACRAAAYYFQMTLPKSDQIEPLFYSWAGRRPLENEESSEKIVAWIRYHRPEAIVGYHNQLIQFVEKAGYRVPAEIGVVHLATDDDVSDWAGIYSNKRAVGTMATEWVVSLIQNRQFGVPKTASYTAVQGTWHPGRTLLIPKPKSPSRLSVRTSSIKSRN